MTERLSVTYVISMVTQMSIVQAGSRLNKIETEKIHIAECYSFKRQGEGSGLGGWEGKREGEGRELCVSSACQYTFLWFIRPPSPQLDQSVTHSFTLYRVGMTS